MTLLGKAKSAARILGSPGGVRQFAAAVAYNVRRWRVCRSKGAPFTYRAWAGQRFVCVPDSATSVQLYVSGAEYEQAEIELCRHWCQPGDACVDAGANIGQYAVLLAEAVGVTGAVIAIEPVPETAQYLRTCLETLRLSQVIVERVCLRDRDGAVEFQAAAGSSPERLRVHEDTRLAEGISDDSGAERHAPFARCPTSDPRSPRDCQAGYRGRGASRAGRGLRPACGRPGGAVSG